ncbi:hypothetical protein QTP88_000720 [Uroleucon formosanum]
MNNVNSTMHELLANDQKLQKNINKIEEQSRRSVATINVLEIQNTFLEHTAILTVFLNQFAWETQNLQSIVNSALNGLMHTNVYPPSKLIHELKQIQLTLPSTLELPITESHLSIPELFRTSKLSVVYIQQNLVFVTRIPLLSNLRFNLFHNIPLSIPTNKENLILTPSRTLSSEIHKDFVPENPKLHAMLKIPELINSHVPEQVYTNKYFKNFNQLAEDAEKLKELSKIPEVAECVQPIHSSINSKSFRASELTDEVKHGDH